MRTNRAFEVKEKVFLIIFEGLSVAKDCLRSESAPFKWMICFHKFVLVFIRLKYVNIWINELAFLNLKWIRKATDLKSLRVNYWKIIQVISKSQMDILEKTWRSKVRKVKTTTELCILDLVKAPNFSKNYSKFDVFDQLFLKGYF